MPTKRCSARVLSLEPSYDILGYIREAAAQQGFHDDSRDVAFGKLGIQVLGIGIAGVYLFGIFPI